MKPQSEDQKEICDNRENPGKWVALGIAVGTAIGVSMDQLSMGVGLGAAFGLIIYAIRSRR